MRLDPTDPRPVYQQVAGQLRQAITSGTYAPGDKMPSARELARSFGIAPGTAASAVDILRDEGLVMSSHGRGVYVLEPGQRPAASSANPQRLAGIETAIADLRQQIGDLRVQVTDLYGRIGAPLPNPNARGRRRRQP